MAKRKPKTAAEFFERERAAWEELDALVADLPDAAWLQPGAAGDWSLKDVWAHLAAWMIDIAPHPALSPKGRGNLPPLPRRERAGGRVGVTLHKP